MAYKFRNPEERIRKIKLARARQIVTDEHKKKISKSLKGRIPWNKGKKMSEDFIEKRRKLSKESWQNSEIREKRIDGMKKWERSEGTKKKIGEANKRVWEDKLEVEKEKFSELARERQNKLWQDPKYRKDLSEAQKGKIGYWRDKKRPEIAGSNCHLWRGGLTRLVKQIREDIKYKQWRREIFERDNFTCRFCKIEGGRIQADHYPKSFAKVLRENKIKTLEEAINCGELWDINNGRTLCLDCHKKTDTYLNKYL